MRFPDDVPTLTDGVVTLRGHQPADLPRIVQQCNDPESIRWTTVPTPYDESDAVDWTTKALPEHWETESTFCFAIEHQVLFAGSVDLRMRGELEA